MNLTELRSKTRALILSIAGFIDAILIIRIAFDLVQVSRAPFLSKLFFDFTDALIAPFSNVFVLPFQNQFNTLNIDAIVSIVCYSLIAIAISEIITAFMYDAFEPIIVNIVDAIFRITEFLLILRIIFYFFQLNSTDQLNSSFVRFVFNITEWTQILGIVPNFLTDFLDWGAIFFLIIIVIIDLITEGFLRSLFVQYRDYVSKRVVKKTIVQPTPVQVVAPTGTPATQHITINVPLPPQQTPRQPAQG